VAEWFKAPVLKRASGCLFLFRAVPVRTGYLWFYSVFRWRPEPLYHALPHCPIASGANSGANLG